MTVSANDRLKTHTGDGSTTAFSYDFPISSDSEIRVTLEVSGVQTVQTLTTHYTVAIGEGGTGTVTFVTAPADGSTIYFEGVTDITQTAEYVNADRFPAAAHEGSMDKLAKVLQEQAAKLSRAAIAPVGSVFESDSLDTILENIDDLTDLADNTAAILAAETSVEEDAAAAAASVVDAEAAQTAAETAETNATAVADNISSEANTLEQVKARSVIEGPRNVSDDYEDFVEDSENRVLRGIERATGKMHFYPAASAAQNIRRAIPKIDNIGDTQALAARSNPRTSGYGLEGSIHDNQGRLIFGPRLDGSLDLSRNRHIYSPDARHVGVYFDGMFDVNGVVGWGLRSDFTFDMNASFHTKDKFFATPSDVSSSIDNYMPLELERYYDTLVSHGGITFSARQVKYKTNGAASTLKTLLINSVSNGVFIPVFGQSNAGEGGSEGLVITEEMFPQSVMNFDGARTKTGTSDLDTTALTDFRPAKDTAAAHYVGTLASYALEMMHRQRTGYPTPGILTATSWEGGKDISFFKQGTTNYDNLIGYGERAKAVFANYGRGVQCPYIVYVQGESGLTSAELQTLASNLTGDMQTALGLDTAPKLLVIQVNETEDESSSINTAIQDIYDAAAASSDIVFGGVMYDCTMDNGSDVIHTDAMGGCMLGERIAMAVYCALTGETLPTFDVDSATASGTSCEITFTHDYVIENDWFVSQSVEDISGDGIDDGSGGDKLIGFNYSDASGTTKADDYTLTSSTVLTLNLNATVSTSPTLSIARDLTLTQSNSFTKTRANVYRNSGFRSPFHDYFKSRPDRLAATGRTNVPEEIRIYCPIREISL